MKHSVYALTSLDWKKTFSEKGRSHSILPYWQDGLYKDPQIWVRHVAPSLISELNESFHHELPEISLTQTSQDGTIKFQIRLSDGLEVETVLIPFHKRYTVCLSTQVGCAMNCSFCYTGTQGFKRNLLSGEIVGQYLKAYQWVKNLNPAALSPNIVFMGQGEPLHNLPEVKKAIEVLNDPELLGIGRRQMTLSTVGYLPGLKAMDDFPRINLALSLHSPFDEERNLLIPINQRFPLDEVLSEIDRIPWLKNQVITYEYLLIKNLNLTDAHAEALSEKLKARKAILNLIPFNPFPGSKWERPSDEETETFRKKLVEKKLRVLVRTTKGDDILAACGQLKIQAMARK